MAEASRPRSASRRPPGLVLHLVRLAVILFLVLPASGYAPLSDASLRKIPSGGADLDIGSGALLAPILAPRVPGTPGSAKAQEHFAAFFREQLPLWTLEWHNSTSTTPATGAQQVPFVNLIFRRDPPWAAVGDVGRLTLVAHYDTLYKPEGFIGATDSAAPCAMLMQVARGIDAALTAKWAAMTADGTAGDGMEEETGVQVILLDGEEAWEQWSHTDSLYGARALAETWESARNPALSVFPTPLNAISLFVLLDLLGAADPHVPSYFPTTHWAYRHLASAETRLRGLGLLESRPAASGPWLPESEKQAAQFTRGFVEDDHIPFMQRGVEILHVIPTPFPPVWHTMDDDAAHLDPPTIRDWARIITVFAAEWMELEHFLPALPKEEAGKKRGRSEKSEL